MYTRVYTAIDTYEKMAKRLRAEDRDRTGDLQIFSLTLSQLSYLGRDLRLEGK